MKEIADWLTEVEEAAGRFYEKASRLFPEDTGLTDLMKRLAEDERLHHGVMKIISNLPEEELTRPEFITEDEESRGELSAYLKVCETRLDEGSLTKRDLMDFTVTIEFSECNDVFLYVVKTFAGSAGTTPSVAENVHGHKARIEAFVAGRPEFSGFLDTVRRIPGPFEKNILVVDDEEGMVEAFTAFLSEEGNIESASNGREALDKLSAREYSAIVTDVDMPVMDGIEFYREALSRHPGTAGRFIFITGDAADDRLGFFEENNLEYFIKPVSLKKIRNVVLEKLGR